MRTSGYRQIQKDTDSYEVMDCDVLIRRHRVITLLTVEHKTAKLRVVPAVLGVTISFSRAAGSRAFLLIFFSIRDLQGSMENGHMDEARRTLHQMARCIFRCLYMHVYFVM